MKISYIAPVATITSDAGIVGETIKNVMQNNIMDPLQQAIQNAIEVTILIPLKTWLHNTWVILIDTSFIFCLTVGFVGAICGVLGIKKGYKISVFSLVFYFLIRLFSYLMGWY